MILYDQAPPDPEGTPPAWLEGAVDLQRREGAGRRWWGIGSGVLCGPQERAAWATVEPGLRACVLKGFDPLALAKQQTWCPTALVADLQGRVWRAPCMLNDRGERQFFVAYGDDFTPHLTPEQENGERIALAVRSAITAANATADTEHLGLPMAMACRAAAAALALVNHIPYEAFAPLRLLDDALIAGVLYSLSGKQPRMGDG